MQKVSRQQDVGDGEGPTRAARKASGRRARYGVWSDRRVRIIALICAILLILYLATVASAVIMGFVANDTPRTLYEQELALARTAYEQGKTDPQAFGNYAVLLAQHGQYSRAHQILDRGVKAKIEDPERQWLTLARAQVFLMQGEYRQAVEKVDALRKALAAQYEKDLAEQKKSGQPTYLLAEGGRGANYFTALLVKAQALEKLKDYQGAVKVLDEYLQFKSTASDIWEWKGDLLLKTKDNEGALKAYRQAQRFSPDAPGLKKKIRDLDPTAQNGE